MLLFSTIAGVFLATFLAAAIAVAVAWLVLHRNAPHRSELDSTAASEDSPLLLKDDVLSTVALLARLLARFNVTQIARAHLAEADLSWTVGRLAAMMLLTSTLVLALATSQSWVPRPVAFAAAALAGLGPYLYVRRRRARRFAQIEAQFPEALDYLARALRAGHSFAIGLDMLSNESPQPLAGELRKTFDEHQLGMNWDKALANLLRRVPLMDVSFFAAAVRLQNRTGGRSSDVYARLAETIRERFALRGEIRAIAAHGKMSGAVLTLLPIVVAAVMMVTSPTYIRVLLQHPRGQDLLWAALAALVLAHLVIRKIVNIKL